MGAQQAVLWAWCPLAAIEAGNNGHVDVVAMVLKVRERRSALPSRSWTAAVRVTATASAAAITLKREDDSQHWWFWEQFQGWTSTMCTTCGPQSLLSSSMCISFIPMDLLIWGELCCE